MAKSETVQVAKAVEVELTNLRGFRDLVGERWGYWLGRRLTQQDMSEKTKAERKVAREIRKAINDNLEDTIRNSDIDGYHTQQKKLKEAKAVVKKKSEPFRKKMAPLAKAQKYMDTVAIPDALKELGKPVQPRFSLSEYITEALKKEKA